MSRVTQAIVATAAIAALAACATRTKEVAVATPPPAPAPVPVYVTPAITPINRGLSPAATVWHMRVALNVAALACRGAQGNQIVEGYRTLLTNQKAALATAETALESQYRAMGGDWQDRYDDAMTRLYNFFSQAPARDPFCTAAAATLTEAERLGPNELQTFAAAVLPTLDAPFAEMLAPRPVIALAAPTSAPAPTPVVGPGGGDAGSGGARGDTGSACTGQRSPHDSGVAGRGDPCGGGPGGGRHACAADRGRSGGSSGLTTRHGTVRDDPLRLTGR